MTKVACLASMTDYSEGQDLASGVANKLLAPKKS